MGNRPQRRAAAARQRKHPEAYIQCVVEDDEPILYIVFDGVKIARRCSGENWTNLEPGFVVRGSEPGGDYGTISIEYSPISAQPQ